MGYVCVWMCVVCVRVYVHTVMCVCVCDCTAAAWGYGSSLVTPPTVYCAMACTAPSPQFTRCAAVDSVPQPASHV